MVEYEKLETIIKELHEHDCPDLEGNCKFCPLYFSGYCMELEELYKRIGYEIGTGEKTTKNRVVGRQTQPTKKQILYLLERLVEDDFGNKFLPKGKTLDQRDFLNEDLRSKIKELVGE